MYEAFQEIIQNPVASLAIIGNLIIIESLLSVDNAAVLATMVMDLPKEQRQRALRYGIFGNRIAVPFIIKVLRETVMGRELFDYAFKEYSRRWAFKHPTPADFFRTMEDASAVDLDWFWRGWFYGTEVVDLALADVRYFRLDTKNPEVENLEAKRKEEREAYVISRERNRAAGLKFAIEQDTSLQDFYNKWDRYAVTEDAKEDFTAFYNSLSPSEKAFYDSKPFFYEIDFHNLGGLVMPLILEWTYVDGTKEVEKISAYIWRKNEEQVTKVFAKKKEVKAVRLDPFQETADIDENNNAWPRTYVPSKFELFKQQQTIRGSSTGPNPMQQRQRQAAPQE